MRFGAMNFPVRPILPEITAIAELGMDYLELAMDPPQAHHAFLRQERRTIQNALKERGLGLVCHLPTFVYTADLTEAIRQASVKEVLGALETAASLEAEKVVLHPSYIGGMAVFMIKQAVALAMDVFAQVARRADRLGLTVCVENMFPRYKPFVEADDFIPVFNAFPQFKLVFDIGHAHLDDHSGNRIAAFLNHHAGRLAHVHISDNRGHLDDHLPVGHGTIDFPAVVERLCRLEYNDTITLEVFSQNSEDLKSSKAKLIAWLAKAHAERAAK